jgi:methylated-DNA-[protein]-cysteine S-methyltransferase
MTKNRSPLPFAHRCYQLLRLIPRGKVTTYKELAKALNCAAYRAVGNAMRRNPDAPVVPCHRVVKSDGGLGGYAGGVRKKIELLKREGVSIEGMKVANFSKHVVNARFLKSKFSKVKPL